MTKAALGHAASIAAMVLTTDSAVVEAPEETHEHAGGGHHGHSHGGHGHSHYRGLARYEGPVDHPWSNRPFVVRGGALRAPPGSQTPTRRGAFSAAISRVRSSSLMPPHTP